MGFARLPSISEKLAPENIKQDLTCFIRGWVPLVTMALLDATHLKRMQHGKNVPKRMLCECCPIFWKLVLKNSQSSTSYRDICDVRT